MARPAWARSTISRSLRIALIGWGISTALFVAVEAALMPWEIRVFRPVLVAILAVSTVYVAAGLLAWWRRPTNRLGVILVAAGYLLAINGFGAVPNKFLSALESVLATAPLAAVVHLLLAFPSGQLRSRAARRTVLAGYGVSLILQVPLYLFGPPGEVLSINYRPNVVRYGQWLQSSAGVIVVSATTLILLQRLRRVPRVKQRVLAPLYLYGVLAVLFVPFSANVLRAEGLSPVTVNLLQLIVVGIIPLAFTLAVLRGGFARTGEAVELAAWLAADTVEQRSLEEGLTSSLGDDSVQLVFYSADRTGYVDAGGTPVSLPGPDADRGVEEIRVGDRLVGAIVYDANLIEDRATVHSIGRVLALAVDRNRLTAELLANQEALRQSRARIVDAGLRERRRIAQSLHDGIQGTLVGLAIRAHQIGAGADVPSRVQQAANDLRTQLDEAANELRHLVHTVMPTPLIERGLAAAIEDLVDRTPLPTRLTIELGPNRLPAPLETTAYFVVSEALTNALKHADASRMDVRISANDDRITIHVHDDGTGGASTMGGTGLRGLFDRVDALGGTLRVVSPHSAGTEVYADFPLTAGADVAIVGIEVEPDSVPGAL